MWYWAIRPIYSKSGAGSHRHLPQQFLAPDLMTAFALARATWPSANAWEAL